MSRADDKYTDMEVALTDEWLKQERKEQLTYADAIKYGYEQAIEDIKADAIDGVIFGNKFFRQKNISLENLTVEQYDRLKGFGEHVKVVIL